MGISDLVLSSFQILNWVKSRYWTPKGQVIYSVGGFQQKERLRISRRHRKGCNLQLFLANDIFLIWSHQALQLQVANGGSQSICKQTLQPNPMRWVPSPTFLVAPSHLPHCLITKVSVITKTTGCYLSCRRPILNFSLSSIFGNRPRTKSNAPYLQAYRRNGAYCGTFVKIFFEYITGCFFWP